MSSTSCRPTVGSRTWSSTIFNWRSIGNRIPNFRFEVYSGTPIECGIYSPGELYPWYVAKRDPRNDANVHLYSGPSSSYLTYYDNINDAIADGLSGHLAEPVNGWSHSITPNFTSNCLGTVAEIHLCVP